MPDRFSCYPMYHPFISKVGIRDLEMPKYDAHGFSNVVYIANKVANELVLVWVHDGSEIESFNEKVELNTDLKPF